MKARTVTALAAIWVLPALAAQTLPASLADYVYTPPPGWTTTVAPDAIVLRFVTPTGERCLIGLAGIAPSSGNLATDLNAAWAAAFSAFELRPTMTFPAGPHLVRGVAAQGWEYLQVKRGIAVRGSPNDPLNQQQFFGSVMVAKLGNRVAPVFAMSLDPLTSSCFGSSLGNVWPRFFASLQFRNFQASTNGGLAEKIVGAWESYGSTVGGGATINYVFTPAGRYAESGAIQRYATDTSMWVGQSFGDGAYAIRGNEIVLTPDRGAREVGSIRLEQVSENGGATWVEKLYLSKPNPMAGGCGQFSCGPAVLEFQMTRRK